MSRVDLLEKMYIEDITNEFDYDKIGAPPLYNLMSFTDTQDLYHIATSLRYNGNIEKKYELIDQIMRSRGFRKAHAGTNRVVYNFLEYPYIVAKVAIDKVGINDSPAEFRNQNFFKPFCCKIHEVDPTGVISIVERVNPISSLEEFISVAEDIFNLITTKIVGKYVLDDIGVTKFMNYGIRNGFGPVILDYPYAYELDGKKLICNKSIKTPYGMVPCGGEIDYDGGFDNLICTKCGRIYQARDLQVNKENQILIMEGESDMVTRSKIVRGGKVIYDSAVSTKQYVTKEQMKALSTPKCTVTEDGMVKVDKTIYKKGMSTSARHAKVIREADRQQRKNTDATPACIKKVSPNYDNTKPATTPQKVNEGKYEPRFNPINIPSDKDKDSEYEKVTSKFNDQMLAYYALKRDKNNKLRKSGKYVSIKSLKQMLLDYETNVSVNNSIDELDKQVGDPEDLTPADNLNINNLFQGSSTNEEEENPYANYEPAEETDSGTDDDSDAVNYSDYVDNYESDNKAAKRAKKAAKSKKNNFEGMEEY